MGCIESNLRESQFDTLFNEFKENGSLWNDYPLEHRTKPLGSWKNQAQVFPYDSFVRYYTLHYQVLSILCNRIGILLQVGMVFAYYI
jgi:hypothetical protein